MKSTHDSQGDCVFRPVQEVSAAAFRPFLVSVWFHVNQFEREEPAWFHRRADTPPSSWTGPNQPENVDNVGSAWLQGDKHTGDLNQRAEADRCVASLQTGRCSAARRHDPNSNREEELNVSPYFNATWFTSFKVSPNLVQSLEIGWSGYGVTSTVIKRCVHLSVTESAK